MNPELVASISIIRAYFHIGYSYDISVLSKFKKSTLHPIWNSLFIILFKCFSRWVPGSVIVSKVFHTYCYTLFIKDKVDLG